MSVHQQGRPGPGAASATIAATCVLCLVTAVLLGFVLYRYLTVTDAQMELIEPAGSARGPDYIVRELAAFVLAARVALFAGLAVIAWFIRRAALRMRPGARVAMAVLSAAYLVGWVIAAVEPVSEPGQDTGARALARFVEPVWYAAVVTAGELGVAVLLAVSAILLFRFFPFGRQSTF